MRVVRVGSRRSPLALAQTNIVINMLRQRFPDIRFEVVGIITEGDKTSEERRRWKGMFVKAIEEKLIEGEIDMAVHSLKDMPTKLPEELTIAAVPKREDPRDALVSVNGLGLSSLPVGARVGTSSLRRRAQLLNVRPDLNIVEVRGNIGTRIDKMHKMGLDAIVLAYAGLRRLGLEGMVSEIIEPEIMIPAAGQGALAVETRKDDPDIISIVKSIEDRETRIAVDAERVFLERIGGGCNLPVAVYGRVTSDKLVIEGVIPRRNDGLELIRGKEEGPVDEAHLVAKRLAESLLSKKLWREEIA